MQQQLAAWAFITCKDIFTSLHLWSIWRAAVSRKCRLHAGWQTDESSNICCPRCPWSLLFDAVMAIMVFSWSVSNCCFCWPLDAACVVRPYTAQSCLLFSTSYHSYCSLCCRVFWVLNGNCRQMLCKSCCQCYSHALVTTVVEFAAARINVRTLSPGCSANSNGMISFRACVVAVQLVRLCYCHY